MADESSSLSDLREIEMIGTFVKYRPHKNAIKMHESNARETIIIAPARSGKTYSIMHEICKRAWNNPTDFAVLVTSQRWRALIEMLENPTVNFLIRCGLLSEHRDEGHKKQEHKTVLKNGKTILWRNLDNADESIRSLNIWEAYIDEATYASRYAVSVVKARLITTNGRLIMVGTPNGTSSWFYHDYFASDAKPPPDTEFIKYEIFDNPIITEEAVERMKATLDPLLVRQEIYGEWVNLTASAVYYAFKRENNVTVEALYNSKYPIYIGLDYNIGKNAWVAFQQHPVTRKIFVFAEGYGAQTTRDVGLQLKTLYNQHITIIDDASGRNRQQGDGLTQREILAQTGLFNVTGNRSNPSRIARYAVVNAHFENGNGQHHLLIHPRCTRLINELETLAYKENTDRPDYLGGRVGHITDALGYGIYYISGGRAAWQPVQKVKYAA